MKNFLTPRNILFYFLSGVVFFLLGMAIAGLGGTGKEQGLAAAGIVVGYGIIAGFLVLIASIFVAQFSKDNLVLLLNKILAVILVLVLVAWAYPFQTRQAAIDRSTTPKLAKAMLPTAPVSFQIMQVPQHRPPMGLGITKPKFYENEVLYFYGNPNLQKPVSDHLPTDSLVFKRTELGTKITYAPYWFVPAHLKMVDEILFLRVLSFNSEFIEVVVNETNGHTAYINPLKNDLKFWPEFLLSINTVGPLNRQNNPLLVKPLSHARTISTDYSFLKPLRIASEGMYVEILNDGFKSLGKRWIKWRGEGKLLIQYSLLS